MKEQKPVIILFTILITLFVVSTAFSGPNVFSSKTSPPFSSTYPQVEQSSNGIHQQLSGPAGNFSTGLRMSERNFARQLNFLQQQSHSSVLASAYGPSYAGYNYSVTFNVVNQIPNVSWSLFIYNDLASEIPALPLYDTLYHVNAGLIYSKSTTSSSITVSLAAGTYFYYAGPSSTLLGVYEINVTGTQSTTVTLPTFYTATFNEKGLVSGLTWAITASASQPNGKAAILYQSSSSSSISAYLPNGLYSLGYSIGSAFIESSPFAISTGGVTEQITIPSLTQVTFQESGLPLGTSWGLFAFGISSAASSVLYINLSMSSSSMALLPEGTYYLTYSAYGVSLGSSKTLCVDATSSTVSVRFPPMYLVKFTETGLSSGFSWNVEVGNNTLSAESSTYTSTINMHLPEGSYYYGAGEDGSYIVSGSFNVTGNGTAEGITFPTVHQVVIRESGLHSGFEWSLSVMSSSFSAFSNQTTASSFTIYLPNGQFNYTYSESLSSFYLFGFTLSEDVTSSGYSFNVTGSSLGVSLEFPMLSTVTFSQAGLKTSRTWGIDVFNENLTGFSESYANRTLSSYSMVAYLFNGTFTYSAVVGGAYFSSNSTFNVTGTSMSESVHFPQLYTVIFAVAGLPTCATTTIDVYPENSSLPLGYTNSTESSSITAYLPNGTYAYTIYLSNGAMLSSTFTVSGKSETVTVSLSATYAVTFSETGLPTGTLWSVDLNGSYNSSTSSSLEFLEFNGTYDFSVYASGFTANVSSGNVSITGAPEYVYVAFTQTSNVTWGITFNETGLPAGYEWNISIQEITAFVDIFNGSTLTSSSFTFEEPNGTYEYSVNASGYIASPAMGNVTVNGANEYVSIQFSKIIYFTGTLSPSNASLYIDGQLIPTVGGVFNVTLTAGQTYEIEVTSPGYKPYYVNESVSATTHFSSLSVKLSKVAPPAPLSSTYVPIIVVVVIVLIGAVAAFAMRARRR